MRRQHLYAVFNHYAIDAFHRTDTVREITCGLTVDVLLFGVLPVPVDVQYNNNDNPRYDFTRIEKESDVHFAHARGFVAKTSAADRDRIRELLSLAKV